MLMVDLLTRTTLGFSTHQPDLQWTDSDGKRHYWEIDRSKSSSIKHGETIQRNDSSGIMHLEILE